MDCLVHDKKSYTIDFQENRTQICADEEDYKTDFNTAKPI